MGEVTDVPRRIRVDDQTDIVSRMRPEDRGVRRRLGGHPRTSVGISGLGATSVDRPE